MADLKKQKTEGGVPIEEEEAEAVQRLQEIQDELEKLNEAASDEILKVEQKYNRERKPVYEKRTAFIAKIPDFWMTVFMSHAELFSILTDDDHQVLEFLKEVDVEDFPDIRSGHTISLTFRENPYFEDTVLKKTYKFSDEGTVKITGTKIRWKPGKDITKRKENGESEPKKQSKKRELEEDLLPSFFKWFDVAEDEQVAEAAEDGIAELIREELWPNPLRFYTQDNDEEGGEEGDEGEEDGDDEDNEDEGEEEGEEDLEAGE